MRFEVIWRGGTIIPAQSRAVSVPDGTVDSDNLVGEFGRLLSDLEL